MRFLSFLVVLPWFCTHVHGARPAPYSLSPNCDVITVNNTEEVTKNYSAILAAPDHCVLFRVADTGTFLARKSQKRWRLESSVESLATISGRSPVGARAGASRPPFFRIFSRARRETQWVEFYYNQFENRTVKGLVPVSLCHSELHGEGSIVSLQALMMSTYGTGGTLSADFDFHNFAISTSAEVKLERANTIAIKVRCAIRHGEIGQLFLANTQYIYYTPWQRTLEYDAKARSFSGDGKFTKKPRERRIVRGGLGDWVCATNSLTELKCDGWAANIFG